MFQFPDAPQTTLVQLKVFPAAVAQDWPAEFHKSGWRSFCRLQPDTGGLSWLLKRRASVFMLTQRIEAAQDLLISIPSELAGEICTLCRTSGLGQPALP